MKPDNRHHNPDPAHIKGLMQATGLSMYKLCARLGLSRQVLHKWARGASECPYIAQYCIERLIPRARAVAKPPPEEPLKPPLPQSQEP